MGYTRDQRAMARSRLTEAEAKAIVAEHEKRMATEGKEAYLAELNEYRAYIGQLESFSDQQREILVHLMAHGMPYRACYESKTPARTYFNWLRDNPEFKEAADECKKFANDRLERLAWALASGEYMRPLVSGGKLAAYEHIYDTRVLIQLLKARKPEQFKDRIDVTSNGHSLVKLVDKDAWDSV